jgi:hypothetical protein
MHLNNRQVISYTLLTFVGTLAGILAMGYLLVVLAQ